MRKFCPVVLIVLSYLLTSVAAVAEPLEDVPRVTLAEAIEKTLSNNRRRPASQYAVAMAEAWHRQALAAWWPQLKATGGYELRDEDPDYLYPANEVTLPATVNITMPGGSTMQMNRVSIPAQEITLMDRSSWRAALETSWLLYDGGRRAGRAEQTSARTKMMQQEARRTDLELIDTVKRYYYSAVLAEKLLQLGSDTLARMETTLDFTEALYKNGSGKVKKTDWLENRVMVESIRAMVAELEKNELLARAALTNTMGLPWQQSIAPAETELPAPAFRGDLAQMVSSSYRFNPDWKRLEEALNAAAGALRTARGGHRPQLALTGELFRWWNSGDSGMATDANKEGWIVGLGVEIPLFNGFLTTGRVAEARARISELKEKKLLLKEGIGLQLRQVFISLQAAEKSFHATKSAMESARENSSLNIRAYQYGLVETDKVIRAQLMESLMAARHFKVAYTRLELQSKINVIVGTEWEKLMTR